MSLLSWFGGPGATAPEIRAEIWSLGARYFGRPLEGALQELNAADLAPGRARLLRACVAQLRLA